MSDDWKFGLFSAGLFLMVTVGPIALDLVWQRMTRRKRK